VAREGTESEDMVEDTEVVTGITNYIDGGMIAYTDCMLSTFDTKLVQKEYKKYAQKHGAQHILLIKRDAIYRNLYIVFPGIGFLIIISIFIVTGIINNIDYSLYWYMKIGLLGCMLLFFLYRVSDKVLNYYLDFTIITPQEIVQYDQK